MTLIQIFPGQGSQVRGMGADLFRRFAAQVAIADDVLGYSLAELCLRDEAGRLARTEYTQPALYAVCALGYLAWREDTGREPDFVAGHSLGEYAALFAAEVFDFATGLRLVQRRGALMGALSGGGMLAVIGVPGTDIPRILEQSGLASIDIANLNAPRQTVLAGPVADLERLVPRIEGAGGRAVPLNVRSAFHSRAMAPVRAEFAAFLASVAFGPPTIPVMANVTARPYRDDAIADTLARQIDSPVRWTETIQYLLEEPGAEFQEIGPGQVLSRLVAEIRRG